MISVLIAALLLPLVAVADQPFASSVFRATHNSYSGNVDGSKNSITFQLDNNVRFIELDVHDNGYATNGDYGIGHSSPGDLVDHNGNPASNLLGDWLAVINTWSAAHPTAAPIVVLLDLKDDLTDNINFAAGNLAAINQRLTNAFGSRLLHASSAPPGLPSVDALRGKVLAVLSGDAGTRTEYKGDGGLNPAVARNARGQVVEVHDDGGSLWYWSGRANADGSVSWLRHGRYDSGVTPAIALNNAGVLVEVHQSQSATTLFSHVGTVDATTGEITWGPSAKYDNGVKPSIAFVDPNGSTVREIHQSQSSSQNWQWSGAVNTGGLSIAWSGNAKTSDALFDKTKSGGTGVSIGSDGLLHYSSGNVVNARIAYDQVAFVEFQAGDSAALQDGAIFYADTASDKSFVTASRQAGKVVRGWDFDSSSLATTPLANYPASNTPYADWYQALLTSNNAVA